MLKRKSSIKSRSQSDIGLIIIVAVLVLFGIIMLYSASLPLGYKQFGDSYYYVKHQLFLGIIPGLVAFVIMSRIDYRRWAGYGFPFLLISVALLLIVFIPGLKAEYGTASSWINIGGFSIQPSEIVKLTFLFYLAAWLGKKEEGIKDLWTGFYPFVFLIGLVGLLMLLQPDMGTMSVIVLTAGIVYFAAGGRISHLIALTAAGAGLFFLLIKSAPYRAARFMTFLHPELDPQGIGYHINQALLAIGSGGWLGRGFGHSRQKFQYLPQAEADSIFAVIAEETGFIVSVLLIVCFLFLMYRGFKIAKNAPDSFGRLLAVGITSWIVLQAFLNIGAMTSLLPLTGIPLPFISYGGTAMVVSLGAMGVLVNISKRRN